MVRFGQNHPKATELAVRKSQSAELPAGHTVPSDGLGTPELGGDAIVRTQGQAADTHARSWEPFRESAGFRVGGRSTRACFEAVGVRTCR